MIYSFLNNGVILQISLLLKSLGQILDFLCLGQSLSPLSWVMILIKAYLEKKDKKINNKKERRKILFAENAKSLYSVPVWTWTLSYQCLISFCQIISTLTKSSFLSCSISKGKICCTFLKIGFEYFLRKYSNRTHLYLPLSLILCGILG